MGHMALTTFTVLHVCHFLLAHACAQRLVIMQIVVVASKVVGDTSAPICQYLSC